MSDRYQRADDADYQPPWPKQLTNPDPTQASAARLTAIAERLKAFVRNNSSPKCRVLSLGDECVCPLCDVDRLLAQIDTLRQEQARLEAEMAEAKASEQRQYDQSVEATVRMLQSEQQRDAALAALRRVRAHTNYVNPTHELLTGLLASIERIADAALHPDTGQTGCDHKFIDSTHCLKCGWRPDTGRAKEGE